MNMNEQMNVGMYNCGSSNSLTKYLYSLLNRHI